MSWGQREWPLTVDTVKNWPAPRDVTELRSFLGLASYYRRFIQDFATVASPMHQLTHKGQPFLWTQSCNDAFHQLRRALSEAPVLAFPSPQLPFVLDTDASDVGIDAVLSQEGEQGEQVIAYFSRSLSRAEQNNGGQPEGHFCCGGAARGTIQRPGPCQGFVMGNCGATPTII